MFIISLDKKIAEMRMLKRSLKEVDEIKDKDILEELEEEKENKKNELTLEEVIEYVKKGEITLNGRYFEFEERSFFNGKLNLPIMKSYFEENGIDEETRNSMKEELKGQDAVILVNDIHNVVFTLSYYKQNMEDMDIDTYKDSMKKELKNMDLYSEILEDDNFDITDLKVNYVIFKIATGMGYTYNYNFFINNKNSEDVFICNLSCMDKDRNIYENIIKAIGRLVFIKY